MKTLFKQDITNHRATETLEVKECGQGVYIGVHRVQQLPYGETDEARESIVIPNDKALELAQSLTNHFNNGWVSVNDRLPNTSDYYLVYYNSRRNHHQEQGWFDADSKYFSYNDYVTHWQPLPAPPNQ